VGAGAGDLGRTQSHCLYVQKERSGETQVVHRHLSPREGVKQIIPGVQVDHKPAKCLGFLTLLYFMWILPGTTLVEFVNYGRIARY